MTTRCFALVAFALTALPARAGQVDLVASRLFEVKTLTPEVSKLKSREASLIAAGKQPVGGQRDFPRDATRRVCCQLILRDRVKGKPHRHDLVIRFFDPRGQLLGETKETLELDGDGGMLSYLASCGSRPDHPWDLGAHRVEVILDGAAIARRGFSILEPSKLAAARYTTDVTLAGGDRYVGEALAGKFDGWGSYYWRDGTRYCGEWEAGTRHGQASMFAEDGSLYVGQVRDNLCTGGLYLWPSGKIAWSRQDAGGDWHNAEPMLGRVRPFNNRLWNDLAFSLDDQHVAWFHVSNLVGRPAELVLYAAYPRAQKFSLYGHLDPSLRDDRAYRQGAATTLDIQQMGEEAAGGTLTAALDRDGVPKDLRKGLDGQHVYRLCMRTPDGSGGASIMLASLTPATRVIGRVEVGDQGRSPERAQVGCFLAPGTHEPSPPKHPKPPEEPKRPPEEPKKPPEEPKPPKPPKETPKPPEAPKKPPKPPKESPKAPPIVVKGTLQPHRYCGGYIQEFEHTTRPRARSYRVIESRLTKSTIAFSIDPSTRGVRGTWAFGWVYLAALEAENGEKGEVRFNFSASGQLVGRYKAKAKGGTIAGTSSGSMTIEMTATDGSEAEKKTMEPAVGSAWAATVDAEGSVTGYVIEAAAGQAGVPFVAKISDGKDGGQVAPRGQTGSSVTGR